MLPAHFHDVTADMSRSMKLCMVKNTTVAPKEQLHEIQEQTTNNTELNTSITRIKGVKYDNTRKSITRIFNNLKISPLS